MAPDPLSPELVLVDPDLAVRARAGLPARPWPAAARAAAAPAAFPREAERVVVRHTYPLWARLTAALWLVVLGILIGGAAIPHAQDRPRVVPASEDAAMCPIDAPTR